MPVFTVLVVVGVFAYLYWKRRTTTLTRNCRWRVSKELGLWHCAYCGARMRASTDKPPIHCGANRDSG